jgi:RNA polymerase sigma-70 factor (ECF subfamily)
MPDGARREPGGDEDSEALVVSGREPEAFERFFLRNWDRVLAYFYRRILCPQTSSELAAETFAQAFESRNRFDPRDGTATAWLFGIAANLYRQWLRHAVVVDRSRRRLRIETPPLADEDLERIESLVDLLSFREALKDGLDRLSPKLHAAVLLRVALDLPYEEVAETLGCSVGAARVRVSRGLDHLLEHMERS